MIADPFAIEGMTDEDRAYRGSRFSDVQAALFANPYQHVWGAAGERPLPVYAVTLHNVLRGLLPFGRHYLFREATARTHDSHADLRWGPDRAGFRRLLHPNGICLTGRWRITQDTPYSGYFRKGSEALIVGRYSTCCSEPRRGRTRSLSMVGKLFPTTDPDHMQPLTTASFITQQDIGGDYSDFINDAELRNAPNTTLWRRGLGAPILAVSGIVFAVVDKMPSIRQLYEIAELAQAPDAPTRTPLYMRLLVAPGQPRIGGDYSDFINDAELRNAPNTTLSRRGLDAPILAISGIVFAVVDKKPSIRQLYEIAELAQAPDAPTRTPLYMRLLVAPNQPRIAGDALDFRDEIMAQIYDRGDPAPKRTLTFNIEVTDEGITRGPNFYERRTFANWRHIGEIVFDRAVASYNGDFVIHFNHPTWRDDPNDRLTATRVKERKVR